MGYFQGGGRTPFPSNLFLIEFRKSFPVKVQCKETLEMRFKDHSKKEESVVVSA